MGVLNRFERTSFAAELKKHVAIVTMVANFHLETGSLGRILRVYDFLIAYLCRLLGCCDCGKWSGGIVHSPQFSARLANFTDYERNPAYVLQQLGSGGNCSGH